MKSFLKSVAGAFVEMEEKQPQKQQPVVQQTIPQQPASSFNSNMPFPAISAADESKFLNHFDELFDKANLPGPDYFEWQNMLKALQATLPENVAYVTAYEALRSMGLDKNKLLDSANKYISILNDDNNSFGKELEIKSRLEVEARRNEVENLKKQIQDKIETINKINQEIAETNTRINKLTQESFEFEQKLSSAHSGYGNVALKRKSLIESHISNINNYIK